MIPVKTVDKVKMLKQVVNAETDAWIGMEDILKEDNYIWKEDNTMLTKEVKTILFKSNWKPDPVMKIAFCTCQGSAMVSLKPNVQIRGPMFEK